MTKIYHSGDVEVKALSNVSFEIEQGGVLRHRRRVRRRQDHPAQYLGGMDTLTSGTVNMDGVEISAFNRTQLENYRRFDIGFVFQFYNLIPNLTALENVEIAAQLCPDHLPAQQVLEAVGLGHQNGQLPLPALRRRAAAGVHRPRSGQSIPSCCCVTSPPAPWTTRRANPS